MHAVTPTDAKMLPGDIQEVGTEYVLSSGKKEIRLGHQPPAYLAADVRP